jgi:glycerate dehydrogenase
MRVVFLDRDSLPVRFNTPKCATSYQAYGHTSAAEVVERLTGAAVAILNKVPLQASALAHLPTLKLVSITATGFDCVDIDACRARGIAVTHVKDYATVSVPEHVFMLILALRRNLKGYERLMQQGAWPKATQFCVLDGSIQDLHGATLGLIGYGSLGQAVAALGRAFGMRVIYYSPSRIGLSPDCVSLDTVFADSDIVSLHCPLNAQTHHLINAARLAQMRRTSLLINTARGALVDEAALHAALVNGVIQGAGLDVLGQEPPPAQHPLLALNLPNLLITPHIAWASQRAMEQLADGASANVDAWALGKHQARVV